MTGKKRAAAGPDMFPAERQLCHFLTDRSVRECADIQKDAIRLMS